MNGHGVFVTYEDRGGHVDDRYQVIPISPRPDSTTSSLQHHKDLSIGTVTVLRVIVYVPSHSCIRARPSVLTTLSLQHYKDLSIGRVTVLRVIVYVPSRSVVDQIFGLSSSASMHGLQSWIARVPARSCSLSCIAVRQASTSGVLMGFDQCRVAIFRLLS
eukprot:scaffold112227_cov35-Attheya_sp.AAC.2